MKLGGHLDNAIRDYQCSGCVCDSSEECYSIDTSDNKACSKHTPGTIVTGIGKIFLGMPKCFNRLGPVGEMKIELYKNYADYYRVWWALHTDLQEKLSVLTLKYKNEKGHTFIKGLHNRQNRPFIIVILEDCVDKIDCRELTEEDMQNVD